MNTSVFKAYDVRGVYPTEINEQTVSIVARACARMFPDGEIITAHDVRHGSPELAAAFEKSFKEEVLSLGKNMTVRTIGLSSTPMFYFLVNYFHAVGGAMITASHNPKNYNGMKVVRAGAEMVPGIELLDFITEHNLS